MRNTVYFLVVVFVTSICNAVFASENIDISCKFLNGNEKKWQSYNNKPENSSKQIVNPNIPSFIGKIKKNECLIIYPNGGDMNLSVIDIGETHIECFTSSWGSKPPMTETNFRTWSIKIDRYTGMATRDYNYQNMDGNMKTKLQSTTYYQCNKLIKQF